MANFVESNTKDLKRHHTQNSQKIMVLLMQVCGRPGSWGVRERRWWRSICWLTPAARHRTKQTAQATSTTRYSL